MISDSIKTVRYKNRSNSIELKQERHLNSVVTGNENAERNCFGISIIRHSHIKFT